VKWGVWRGECLVVADPESFHWSTAARIPVREGARSSLHEALKNFVAEESFGASLFCFCVTIYWRRGSLPLFSPPSTPGKLGNGGRSPWPIQQQAQLAACALLVPACLVWTSTNHHALALLVVFFLCPCCFAPRRCGQPACACVRVALPCSFFFLVLFLFVWTPQEARRDIRAAMKRGPASGDGISVVRAATVSSELLLETLRACRSWGELFEVRSGEGGRKKNTRRIKAGGIAAVGGDAGAGGGGGAGNSVDGRLISSGARMVSLSVSIA